MSSKGIKSVSLKQKHAIYLLLLRRSGITSLPLGVFREIVFLPSLGREEIRSPLKTLGNYGRAFKVVDSKRGQLGHLQREVVSVLWPLTSEISW